MVITWETLFIPLAVIGACVVVPFVLWVAWSLYFLIGFLIKGDEWG